MRKGCRRAPDKFTHVNLLIPLKFATEERFCFFPSDRLVWGLKREKAPV